jgi:hypothetical protein
MFSVGDHAKCKIGSSLHSVIGDEVGIVVEICESSGNQLVSVFFEIYGCTQGFVDQDLYDKV